MLSEAKSVHLYDASTIDSLIWPETADGDYAKRFLPSLVKNGIDHYIDNIKADIKVIKFDNLVMPIIIVDNKYDISHVCSPYAHYISFALEYLHLMENSFVRGLTKVYLKLLGKILRLGKVNKIVYVNNWLFAVDLYPAEMTPEAVGAITSFLQNQYSDHTIAFRSINSATSPESYRALKRNAFDLIASRQIYVTDAKNESLFQTRIFKSDMKLMKEKDYEILNNDQLSTEEVPRVLELYKKLYIDKYSELHPQVNIHYMQLIFDQQLMHIKALKKNGTIEGAAGIIYRNGVMYTPFFGYETNLPQEAGLYRILSTVLSLEAKQRGLLFNQSAGASFYKKIRKAEPSTEYLAVYHKHLPYLRRLPWKLLKGIMNTIAIHFMKKY